MGIIIGTRAREIIDSRGNPTLEVEALLSSGAMGRAMVPSGASTGKHEAVELRDGDLKRFRGKGVLDACKNVNETINEAIEGLDASDLLSVDNALKELDGTSNKGNMGANAMLGVSMALVQACAAEQQTSLYKYIGGINANTLPVPLMNVLNGGAHALSNVDFQEFMLVPWGFDSFSESLRAGIEVYHQLRENLMEKGLSTGLGDEGGYAPDLDSTEIAIELLLKSIEDAGYRPNEQISLALDIASSEFYEDNKYVLRGADKVYTSEEFADYQYELVEKYPIVSIEDGLAEDDWEGWSYYSKKLNDKVQLVGDDLFVTNPERLQKGIDENIANSILVKVNQIGTVSETLEVMQLAAQNDYSCVVSHRSGETEDNFIADLAVATNCGQIKTGAPARSDRVAKYNQLLRIEEELNEGAQFSGKRTIKG